MFLNKRMEFRNCVPVVFILLFTIKNSISIILTKSNNEQKAFLNKVPATTAAVDYHQGLSSLNQLEYVPVPYSYKSSYWSNVAGVRNETKNQVNINRI